MFPLSLPLQFSSMKELGQIMNRCGNQIFRSSSKFRVRRSSRFSVISCDHEALSTAPRTYQVVVAATQNMGIGKEGRLPWKLPSDLKFFKHITATTADPDKTNAVVMGRKTWESVPIQFRPLPARLNVVLTRSLDLDAYEHNVLSCQSIRSALVSLALPPYRESIEKVFVIGGGEILSETLNATECDAIHITEIETSIDCDTFIPAIDRSLFRPWCSSEPLVENNVRFSFATYIRTNSDTCYDLLPRTIFESHGEYSYLKLLREIALHSFHYDENVRKHVSLRSDYEMKFNLRKSFPLLTSKRVSWNQVLEEFFGFTSQSSDQLSDVIMKIRNVQHKNHIILSPRDQSDLRLEFCVANGELSCEAYEPFGDMVLSVPLSIASYALLTHVVAHLCGTISMEDSLYSYRNFHHWHLTNSDTDLIAGGLVYKLGEARVNRTQLNSIVHHQIHKFLPKPFPVIYFPNPI